MVVVTIGLTDRLVGLVAILMCAQNLSKNNWTMNQGITTRDKIMEAAETVFSQKGYYETAVDEIVKQSSTSKGSVYFHFPSKESLFIAVMDHLGNRLIRRVEQAIDRYSRPSARLETALITTLETLTKHKTIAKMLLIKGYSMGETFPRKRQEIFSRLAALIKVLLDDISVVKQRREINTEVAAYAWLGAISEVVVQWIENGNPHPVLEAFPTLRALIFKSLDLEE